MWRGRREPDSQVFCHPRSAHALAFIDKDIFVIHPVRTTTTTTHHNHNNHRSHFGSSHPRRRWREFRSHGGSSPSDTLFPNALSPGLFSVICTMSTFCVLRWSVVLRSFFGTVSAEGLSFVPFCSPVAADSTSLVSDASMVLPSVPGYLEAREDFVDGSMWFLPAAPSLLGGITGEFWSDLLVFKPCGCFAAIDAAMPMTPLSEDWPVQLGVWPAPSFQP